MSKMLKNMFFTVICIMISSVCIFLDYAKADDNVEGGTNEYGDFLYPMTLTARCNIKNLKMEQDCIRRLAYDYITNAAHLEMFRDYNHEQETILGEYYSAYIDFAISKIINSGNQEDELNKKTCVDDSGEECGNVGSDTLTVIRFNNNVSVNTTKLLTDINMTRSSDATINIIEYLLKVIVPATEVDITDQSLAGPPQ